MVKDFLGQRKLLFYFLHLCEISHKKYGWFVSITPRDWYMYCLQMKQHIDKREQAYQYSQDSYKLNTK